MSMETIHYRDGIEADLGAMLLVMARANAQRDGQPLPQSAPHGVLFDDLRARMHKDDAWTHVANGPTKMAGFMLGYPYAPGEDAPVDPTKEYLSLLMIEPEYWGRGIAGRLLDIAADRARRTNKDQLLLWTRADHNERARGVYEHKGYTATGLTRMSRHGLGLQVQYALDL